MSEMETIVTAEDPFARQRLIDWWDQTRLAEARVLVVGAGALGNEVLKNLALVGVGTIYVIDFDIVEPSNLSRAVLFRSGDSHERRKAEVAAERIAQLHPHPAARIAYAHGDLVWDIGAGVYRAMTAVLGCLDNVEARRCVNLYSWQAGTPWIDGGIHQLSGSVGFYTANPDQACYECGMTDELRRLANQRYSCMSGVVLTQIANGHEATTQTTSAIVAALQTQEAIKICHGMEVPAGKKVYYHGLLHNFEAADPSTLTVTDLAVAPECLCHGEEQRPAITVAPLTNLNTADDVLAFARQTFGMSDPVLQFGLSHPSPMGRSFVISACCPQCDHTITVERPAHRVMDYQVICPHCPFICPRCDTVSMGRPTCPSCEKPPVARPTMRLDAIHCLDAASAYSQRSLADLGIPNLDIVKVADAECERYIQIGDDLSLVFTVI